MDDENKLEPLLDAEEAARILGFTEGTVRNYASRGLIPSIKLPTGALRFRASDLRTWIDSHPKSKTDDEEAPAA